eukprot:341329_1
MAADLQDTSQQNEEPEVEGKNEVDALKEQLLSLQKQVEKLTLTQKNKKQLKHTQKLEKYHPMGVRYYKKRHTKQFGRYHTQKGVYSKHHPGRCGPMNGYGAVWSCCHVLDHLAKPCKTIDLIYLCCGTGTTGRVLSIRKTVKGCKTGYLCCHGDANSDGCYQKAVYECCGGDANKGYGCQMRYKCCLQPYGSDGCQ